MEIKDIKKIVELMEEHDLTRLELEEETFRISLVRGAQVEERMVTPLPVTPPTLPSAPAATAPVPEPKEEDGLLEIKSPIVGTFYRAGSPDADAFAKVGQQVDTDTVVCIVEAMKVMNEIKAELKGTITEVLVENATPVMFGEPLFKVKPL